MPVKTDSPLIAALRNAVEHQFGHPVASRADFTHLAACIQTETGDHLGENTLRRLWGSMDSYDSVFTSTLDILSRYAGYRHWNDFCEKLHQASGRESDIIGDGCSIKSDEMHPGDKVRIGWLPDRLCTLEYLGSHKFKAVECENSTLSVGDTFECSIMIKHYPLFVDNLLHDGRLSLRYCMGIDNGLTILEKIKVS